MPDTGQRTCSDSRVEQPCPEDAGMPFHGQDAQYGLDLHVADETRRFHSRDDNENGQWVVLDRVTQLQWQRCPPGLMGEQCEEEHNLHYSALSFQDAEEYCALLADARYGGLSEWRVPKVHELWSIVNHDTGEPAAYHVFPATLASAYWSATSRAGFHDNDYLWTVDFFDGLTDGRRSDSSHLSVRCVSPNRHLPRGELRRVEESDSVVVDSGTGLTWQGCVFGQEGEICDAAGAEPMIWEHALSSCQGLDWAGYGDWRLPSINEIMSIVDYTRNDPAIGPALSSGIELLPTGALLWSSTSSLGSRQAEPALMVHSGGGHSEARAKSENAYVICVRGGP